MQIKFMYPLPHSFHFWQFFSIDVFEHGRYYICISLSIATFIVRAKD